LQNERVQPSAFEILREAGEGNHQLSIIAAMPPASETMTLTALPRFSFTRTVLSHGWYALPPFSYNKERRELHRVLRLNDGTISRCILSGNDHKIMVLSESARPLTTQQRKELVSQLRTCLRLDEDFTEFHSEARRHPEFRWVSRSGAGRLLRSPTVFEDTVKMMCTTNCTWALTTLMVTNLVEAYGEKADGDAFAFPLPERIAGSSERVLRKSIKAGYRSPFLLELAEKTASGQINPEEWRTSSTTTEKLFEKMCRIKGIGPYAAGNILKLVGRYDYLGLDSWVRAKYAELHHKGRHVKDSTIERHYAPYGKWRGLFFWLEMTRSWHNDHAADLP
jgi:N-glycosylase/DNA lyase